MLVDTMFINSLCQSATINARSIIDLTYHFKVHQWSTSSLTRCRKLQLYNDLIKNDNNQWSTSPTCI